MSQQERESLPLGIKIFQTMIRRVIFTLPATTTTTTTSTVTSTTITITTPSVAGDHLSLRPSLTSGINPWRISTSYLPLLLSLHRFLSIPVLFRAATKRLQPLTQITLLPGRKPTAPPQIRPKAVLFTSPSARRTTRRNSQNLNLWTISSENWHQPFLLWMTKRVTTAHHLRVTETTHQQEVFQTTDHLQSFLTGCLTRRITTWWWISQRRVPRCSPRLKQFICKCETESGDRRKRWWSCCLYMFGANRLDVTRHFITCCWQRDKKLGIHMKNVTLPDLFFFPSLCKYLFPETDKNKRINVTIDSLITDWR